MFAGSSWELLKSQQWIGCQVSTVVQLAWHEEWKEVSDSEMLVWTDKHEIPYVTNNVQEICETLETTFEGKQQGEIAEKTQKNCNKSFI